MENILTGILLATMATAISCGFIAVIKYKEFTNKTTNKNNCPQEQKKEGER